MKDSTINPSSIKTTGSLVSQHTIRDIILWMSQLPANVQNMIFLRYGEKPVNDLIKIQSKLNYIFSGTNIFIS